jgi:hypothetical protein
MDRHRPNTKAASKELESLISLFPLPAILAKTTPNNRYNYNTLYPKIVKEKTAKRPIFPQSRVDVGRKTTRFRGGFLGVKRQLLENYAKGAARRINFWAKNLFLAGARWGFVMGLSLAILAFGLLLGLF